MKTITPLSQINQSFEKMIDHIKNRTINQVVIKNHSTYIIFLSIGNPHIRARVLKEVSPSLSRALDNLKKRATNLVRNNHVDPKWMKIDIVTEVKEVSFESLEQLIAETRRNYFRYGIAFDDEFRLAFLEQEINGNAMLRSVNKSPVKLSVKNINHYLKTHFNNQPVFMKKRFQNKSVYLFKTTSFFNDEEQQEIVELLDGEYTNGIRKTDNLQDEVADLIKKSTYFLTKQVHPSGKFNYGYFSAFAKQIDTYNILRHSSSLYSMAEGYEIIKDDQILEAVQRGIEYLTRKAIVYQDGFEDVAFVVDHANEKEIKLGSNATAILAMAKYMEVTNSTEYLEVAQALARGILRMKIPSGGFIHVLTYPTYEIKDMRRIIYYEGEAIFSLLRLYAIDKEEIWLNEVKHTFEYFIKNKYWKYHDHWLSYAANELTMHEPKDKYFIFGLKNCNERLDFIYHRETTYPTFLELTMAAYKMIRTIKSLGKHNLLEYIDEAFLEKTIDHRAEYQRVGFFYPEMAMYMKQPSLILDSFFIRHHSFRVRIDDVEHYLSGYCQYFHHRIPKLEEK